MSVKIPSSFDFGIDLGVDLDISGIPTSYSIATKVEPLSMHLDLAPIEIKPIDFSLRVKEIPSVRVHLPLDYRVGLSVLGSELLCVRLCGQGQVITEPYAPNPCEARPAAVLQPQPDLQTLDRLVAELDRG
ncbi:conserved hypothetical protein [Rubrivivax sp. A210]|uniref:hypothetical protein n=1 Tax=Rubrivivax sp. A210 TaxID=2772301 RepID=UPI00191B48CC|nr:hypothetical protein [Rubrivivax sp. A210]CAD5371613.1 conserved hypothetical protein [Rubrivivax sp. A210]